MLETIRTLKAALEISETRVRKLEQLVGDSISEEYWRQMHQRAVDAEALSKHMSIEISDKAKRIAELEADKARLDWLEKDNAEYQRNCIGRSLYRVGVEVPIGKTVRDAIDSDIASGNHSSNK